MYYNTSIINKQQNTCNSNHLTRSGYREAKTFRDPHLSKRALTKHLEQLKVTGFSLLTKSGDTCHFYFGNFHLTILALCQTFTAYNCSLQLQPNYAAIIKARHSHSLRKRSMYNYHTKYSH